MATIVLESLPVPRATSSSLLSKPRASLLPVSASLLAPPKPLRLAFPSSPSRFVASRRSRIVCEAQDTAVDVAAVGDSSWQSLVLECELPVLVEFWAPWCGPCRMIHPVIDDLAKQYAGKLKCYKVNTDDSPSIASQYGIRSIPTVMIFKNGEKKDAVIGAVPKTTLTTSIEKLL